MELAVTVGVRQNNMTNVDHYLFCSFSALSSTLCSSGSLFEEGGDDVIGYIKKLLIDLFILTAVVITIMKEDSQRDWTGQYKTNSSCDGLVVKVLCQ